MAKHQVNTKELCEKINRFRMENQKEIFDRNSLSLKLREIGVRDSIISRLITKGFIPFEANGCTRMYMMSPDPIPYSVINSLYEEEKAYGRKWSKNHYTSKDPIALLKEQGYIIQKPVGFNEELFKKENPELYKKYIIYEEY